MHRTLRKTAVGLVAAILMAGGALAASATSAAAADAQSVPAGTVNPLIGGVHPIRNAGNGLCLQPTSTLQFAQVVQEPCDGSTLQGWEYQPDPLNGSNHYYFVNQASGWCLDAFDGAANGDRVLADGCAFLRNNETISNQEWNAGTLLPNTTKLESRVHFTDTGFCVDVPGAQSTPGLAMQIYSCNGTSAQVFFLGLL
jgi:hypothetical protein